MKFVLALILLVATSAVQARTFYDSDMTLKLSYSNAYVPKPAVLEVKATVRWSDDSQFCALIVKGQTHTCPGDFSDPRAIGMGFYVTTSQLVKLFKDFSSANPSASRIYEMLEKNTALRQGSKVDKILLVYNIPSGMYVINGTTFQFHDPASNFESVHLTQTQTNTRPM